MTHHGKSVVPRGWMWIEKLQLWLGTWEGEYTRRRHTWFRFFTPDGQVVMLEGDYERVQAEAERARADALERELSLLRQSLGKQSP